MRLRTLTMPLLVSLMGGCGTRPDPDVSSSLTETRELVKAALEGWKLNQSPVLTDSGQALRFEDEDARAGLTLLTYEIRDTPSEWNEEAGLPVTLSLRDKRGHPIVRHAVYMVTRHSGPVVVRDD